MICSLSSVVEWADELLFGPSDCNLDEQEEWKEKARAVLQEVKHYNRQRGGINAKDN